VDHGTGKIWKVFVALVGVPKQKKTHRGVNDQQQGDQDDGIQHGRQRSQQGGQGTFKKYVRMFGRKNKYREKWK